MRNEYPDREEPIGRLTAGELVDALEICRHRLRDGGLDVIQMTDLRRVENVINEVGKPYLTRQLDPMNNDFHGLNTFWMKIVRWEKDDQAESGGRATEDALGIAGARMDSLPEGEFPKFLRNHLHRLFAANREDRVLPEQVFPPEIYQMNGNIVYLGDFFSKPEIRGIDFDKGAYTMALYIFAMLEWRFDWLYLFIRKEHAEKGYFSRYNIPISYPGSVLWENAPPERSDMDHLGIVSRASFAWMIRRLLRRSDLF